TPGPSAREARIGGVQQPAFAGLRSRAAGAGSGVQWRRGLLLRTGAARSRSGIAGGGLAGPVFQPSVQAAALRLPARPVSAPTDHSHAPAWMASAIHPTTSGSP